MNFLRTVERQISGLIFLPQQDGRYSKVAVSILLALLFAMGIMHWVLFFESERGFLGGLGFEITFNAQDWHQEFVYHSVLKEAVSDLTIPYHVVSEPPFGPVQFLGNSQLNLSPQIALLSVMEVKDFLLFDTLFLYSLGFFGCLLIRKRYQLSIFAFTVFFLLFNFNGHIVSHMAVGHPWVAYFLLPFFFLFVMELVEEESMLWTPIKISLALFAIYLNGGFLIVFWCLTFLLLMLVLHRGYLKQVLTVLLVSSLLGAFRLLPAAVAYWDSGRIVYAAYPNPGAVLESLAIRRDQTYINEVGSFGYLGWWEYDMFIGVIGLLTILYFGVVLRFSKDHVLVNYKYAVFDAPIVLMTLLTVSTFYARLASLEPLTLLEGAQRFPSRMLVIPVIMLALLAVIRMQPLLSRIIDFAAVKILAVVALLAMAYALARHSATWKIARIEEPFAGVSFEPAFEIVGMSDTWYKATVVASALITAITLICLLAYVAWRFYRKSNFRLGFPGAPSS